MESRALSNTNNFPDSLQGRYQRRGVLWHNERLNKCVKQFARENASVKEQPNMTARSFCQYVNEELPPNEPLEPGFLRRVSVKTSRKWLHELGFHVLDQKKGNTLTDMKEMMWLSIGGYSFVKWLLWDLLTKTMLQQSKMLSVFQVILNVILLLFLTRLLSYFMMNRYSRLNTVG